LNIGHKGETFNDIINRLIEQNRGETNVLRTGKDEPKGDSGLEF
jgi:predicted CopG family antitoxin